MYTIGILVDAVDMAVQVKIMNPKGEEKIELLEAYQYRGYLVRGRITADGKVRLDKEVLWKGHWGQPKTAYKFHPENFMSGQFGPEMDDEDIEIILHILNFLQMHQEVFILDVDDQHCFKFPQSHGSGNPWGDGTCIFFHDPTGAALLAENLGLVPEKSPQQLSDTFAENRQNLFRWTFYYDAVKGLRQEKQ